MSDNPAAMLGAVIAAGAMASASLKDLTILQNLLVGIGLGTLIGKVLVWRQERRRRRELAARRVRQIETLWMVIGALFGVAMTALLALL